MARGRESRVRDVYAGELEMCVPPVRDERGKSIGRGGLNGGSNWDDELGDLEASWDADMRLADSIVDDLKRKT
ncbi:hypothetical protein Tco_0109488 [Tanacetum coccineum]